MNDSWVRTLVESQGDGLIAVDRSGSFAYVSPAAAALTGIGPTDARPEQWAETFGILQSDELTAVAFDELPLVRAMRGESSEEVALFIRNASVAEGRQVSMLVKPWRDARGESRGGVVSVRDNTARVMAEREARKVGWFLESIVENVPAMIFVKDARDLRFERFNRAGEALLGMRREELLGKSDYDFFPQAQADCFTQHDRETLARQGVLDILEEPIQTAHGERWLHTRKVPIRDEQGEPKYLLGISIDITARKLAEDDLREAHDGLEARVRERTAELEAANIKLRAHMTDRLTAENALRESETALLAEAQKLQVILDSLDEGVMLVSTDARVRMLNRAAHELFDRVASDPGGWSTALDALEMVRADTRGPVTNDERVGARALRGETVEELDLVIRGVGATADSLIRMSARPLRNEAGEVTGAVMTARDVTENLRMAQLREQGVRLEEQNRSVIEASRLKSEFLANMSHELRTPLNAIIGFGELLRDGVVPAGSPEVGEFLNDIVQSGWQLLALINDVLDLAKVEAGKLEFHPEKVDLRIIFGDIVHLQRAGAKAHQVSLAVEVDAKLAEVQVDPTRLTQIVNNYLSNALKFTPEGGTILLRAKPAGQRSFRIEVEDNGIGIAEEDVGRLFVEFQQLEAGAAKKFAGTGLGLALTRRLVEAQGGSVGVRSTLGKGSTFFAVLPLVAKLHTR